MLNFGLTDLRLVSPRDGWPNPSAGPAASGADIVLEKAQVFDTVADAVGDCPFVSIGLGALVGAGIAALRQRAKTD